MHAIWYEELGPAEPVLKFGEIEVPALGENDVLVRVHTSGVNPSDSKRRMGFVGLRDFLLGSFICSL